MDADIWICIRIYGYMDIWILGYFDTLIYIYGHVYFVIFSNSALGNHHGKFSRIGAWDPLGPLAQLGPGPVGPVWPSWAWVPGPVWLSWAWVPGPV